MTFKDEAETFLEPAKDHAGYQLMINANAYNFRLQGENYLLDIQLHLEEYITYAYANMGKKSGIVPNT